MSTQWPGDLGPGDLGPGDLGPPDPGLSKLIAALTAEPAPAELAGESAMLALFRAHSDPSPSRAGSSASPLPGQAGPPPGLPPGQAGLPAGTPATQARRATPVRGHLWRLRSGFAAAVVLALAGTVTAAYAAVLPAPVQHIAYQVLGFAGVPDVSNSKPSRPKPVGSHRPHPTRSGGPANSSPAHPSSKPSPSASPAPASSTPAVASRMEKVSITAQQTQIAAGGTAILTGQATRGGRRPIAGAALSLQERLAGQTRWQPAGTVTTSATGRATIDVSDLATNAGFRFAGPQGRTSATVTVTVVPAISLRQLVRSRGLRDAFAARSPFAQAGDVVELQVRSGSGWVSVRVRRLGGHRRATFVIAARRAAGHTLRVVLLATDTHAAAASSPLLVPSG